MKTSDILLETTERVVEISLDFNDLTSIQIGALRAIADGRLDFDNASDRMMDVVYELQDFNLVDPVFELTSMGRKAVDLAIKLGGTERRTAAARAAKKTKLDTEDIYSDEDYPDAEYDDDWSEYNTNVYGAPTSLT